MASPAERGTICYTTMIGGLGHDQGTRPVLVIGDRKSVV